MMSSPILDYRQRAAVEKPTRHSPAALVAIGLLIVGTLIQVMTICVGYQWITYRWDRLYARFVSPYQIRECLLLIYLAGCVLGMMGLCRRDRKQAVAIFAILAN